MSRTHWLIAILLTAIPFVSTPVDASHISGIRVTQTGGTDLQVDVDVTAFYTTGSTASEAYLGTYYNAVPAIDWGDGSTTPRYGYGPSTGLPLVATSTVVNGIPARAYRGSFSHTYGASGDYTITSNTRCCPLTTPTYTLVTGTIITTTVTTTGVFGPTTFTTSFVQNTAAVTVTVPPTFDKTFGTNPVGAGNPTTLSFAIDNTANHIAATSLAFTDTLPAGLVVADTPNAMNGCGGTVTATAGSGTISLAGGMVAAGATCTIDVDTVATADGTLVNTSGDLTSSLGNSGTATDTLEALPPVGFTKSFSPEQITPGEVTTLSFLVDNSAGGTALTDIAFTDNLPAGMVVATPANANDGCGGTLTAMDGASVITYTDGMVGANATCMITVDITVTMAGQYTNLITDATSSAGAIGSGGTASAPLAGGNIVDVPTSSEAGLALLAGLLGLLAILAIRRTS